VAIGQKLSTIAQVVKILDDAGAMKYSTVVVASASEPAPLQYIAPYTGVTMGEYFPRREGHALCIYDDLSKHATAYRQLSLRSGGRRGAEAYPATSSISTPGCWSARRSSTTSSARLADGAADHRDPARRCVRVHPDNVISITDGQIYLEADLIFMGHPARR